MSVKNVLTKQDKKGTEFYPKKTYLRTGYFAAII